MPPKLKRKDVEADLQAAHGAISAIFNDAGEEGVVPDFGAERYAEAPSGSGDSPLARSTLHRAVAEAVNSIREARRASVIAEVSLQKLIFDRLERAVGGRLEDADAFAQVDLSSIDDKTWTYVVYGAEVPQQENAPPPQMQPPQTPAARAPPDPSVETPSLPCSRPPLGDQPTQPSAPTRGVGSKTRGAAASAETLASALALVRAMQSDELAALGADLSSSSCRRSRCQRLWSSRGSRGRGRARRDGRGA